MVAQEKNFQRRKKIWWLNSLAGLIYESGTSGQCLYRESGCWAEVFAPAVLVVDLEGFTSIINGSELHSSNFVSTFLERLIFSQLYDFIKSHKQFVYNKNIPHTSCLYDACENIWIIINNSQLQLVFPKHRMVSLKNTAVHLMTKSVCLMIAQNVHLENYAYYLIPTLIQNLIWILLLIPTQAAWYLSTIGLHPTRMLPK